MKIEILGLWEQIFFLRKSNRVTWSLFWNVLTGLFIQVWLECSPLFCTLKMLLFFRGSFHQGPAWESFVQSAGSLISPPLYGAWIPGDELQKAAKENLLLWWVLYNASSPHSSESNQLSVLKRIPAVSSSGQLSFDLKPSRMSFEKTALSTHEPLGDMGVTGTSWRKWHSEPKRKHRIYFNIAANSYLEEQWDDFRISVIVAS